MLSCLLLLFSSFILSLILLFILGKISGKFNLLKINKKIPYTGGLAFSLAFIVCYLFFNFIKAIPIPTKLLWIIIFSFLLLGIEFIDDLKNFSLKPRVIVQIIFIFLFLLYSKRIQIYFLPGWLNYLLSFLWLMGVINAFNHLDVGDGVCAGVSLIASLSFFMVLAIKEELLLARLFLTLAGVVFAFFLFNKPPAKIFMGNSGSHFLGFLFASLSMYGDYATKTNPFSLIAPLLILAFPFIDTLFLIIVRTKKGVLPLRKSDDHIFLRLRVYGYSAQRALLFLCLISLIWGLSGIFVIFGFNLLFLMAVIFACFSTVKIILKARS